MSNIAAPSPSATIADGIIFPVLCTFIVISKFLAKRYLGSKILIEDWLTIPALICTIGMGVALILGVAAKGLGYPTPHESETFVAHETVSARQVEFAIELLQMPALTCTKLSLLLFYRRVFDAPWRMVLRFTFAFMLTVCTLWGFGFFFSMTFICGTHFSAFWDSTYQLRQHCPHLHAQQAWLACSDFVIDAIILFIPLPMIFRLNMTARRKFAIWTVFLFASLTVSASITRMVIFLRAIEDLRKRYAIGGHDNQIITAGLYWTMFETGLGLIVVCLPSLYVLLRSIYKPHLKHEKSDWKKEIRVTVDVIMRPASGHWEDLHDSAISGCEDHRHQDESQTNKSMEDVSHEFTA